MEALSGRRLHGSLAFPAVSEYPGDDRRPHFLTGVGCGTHRTEGAAMTFQVGDRVVAEAESTERRPRGGTVRDVVRDDPARYRIEWDDGRESIYTPAAGALHPERSRAGTAT